MGKLSKVLLFVGLCLLGAWAGNALALDNYNCNTIQSCQQYGVVGNCDYSDTASCFYVCGYLQNSTCSFNTTWLCNGHAVGYPNIYCAGVTSGCP